ncbi:molybdate ABC transporter substrate-binding protein [Kocuria massiliensis]|uniref:molybdate ABC transporter substrate-binding protein n=1 Tax=Kocuria massiliensis TaxID=1926282 RepID=UPI001C460EDB|nr:molybdate ABC transporter substrate-binding protein [Kocuria massiliensis]
MHQYSSMNASTTGGSNRKTRWALMGASTMAIGVLALSGCGSSGASDATSSGSASASDGEQQKTITVFAAASLHKAGEDLAKKYEADHPGVKISWNFAGSSKLVQQMREGASADLFISADQANMNKALKTDAFHNSPEPKVIASNTLQLVTAPGNPGHVSSIQDAADRPVAVCAPEVPCGTLAKSATDAAGVHLNKASQEANVSAVSTKVSQGEVDAGFIYSTDALNLKNGGKDVTAIDLQGISNNKYPAAMTTSGQDRSDVKDFYQWLASNDAQQILKKYGFEPGE